MDEAACLASAPQPQAPAAGLDPRWAALVVHDLKNELGNLESQLLLVEREPSIDGAARARRQCQQLRRDLVAFLTIYRGEGLRAAVEDASPSWLLESLAAEAAAHAPQLQLVLRIDAAPAFWFYDPRLVRLALDAALDNACRYARREVLMSATLDQGELLFAIEDDGPGPAQAAQMAPAAWSTGLGTELCRMVAQAHTQGSRQGSAQLSARAGGGARFTLRLP